MAQTARAAAHAAQATARPARASARFARAATRQGRSSEQPAVAPAPAVTTAGPSPTVEPAPSSLQPAQARSATASTPPPAPIHAESAPPLQPASPERSDRRRWIALAVLCLGQLMMVLDATIVNVALPSIQRDLHFTQSNLTWVMDGYLITFGGLLLLAGRMGDLVGRKRVFLTGLVMFTAASVLCGVSQSQTMLIGARLLQGVGGAVASSVILAIIVTEFPKRAEQAKAMGVYAFVSAGGGSIGLLAGGALTQSLSWHWIFFVNVPIGVLAFVLGLDADRRERGHRPGGRGGRARLDPGDRGDDARRLRDRQVERIRADLRAHAGRRRRLGWRCSAHSSRSRRGSRTRSCRCGSCGCAP